MVDEMKPCPFCGTAISILVTNYGYQWYGDHKGLCPLDGNPSGAYGRPDFLLQSWNARYTTKKK